eukprot:TRINITY_DN773_c0_g1_i5.p2 TRINITY_DN773_c0_g1~~TRINITY_DN773_c0_g1_i5.p2  ORF type:complete len:106 (+),score=30.71 TRINITY_DN773_c0_g1_i5:217-534(+)
MEFHEYLIEENDQQIAQVEESVNEVAQLFHEFGQTVQEQQVFIGALHISMFALTSPLAHCSPMRTKEIWEEKVNPKNVRKKNDQWREERSDRGHITLLGVMLGSH